MKLLLALLCLSLSAHAQLRPGETELTLPSGALYQGTVKDGVPDGSGYLRSKSGWRYEGGFKDGMQHGRGILITPLGDRYEGQFENGQYTGNGKMVFGVGGSYEGQWKQGTFHGKGVMVYAGSGRQFAGEFAEGRPVGATAPTYAPVIYRAPDEASKLAAQTRGSAVIAVPFPLDKRFEDMSATEQDAVRSRYPALAPGDEPPFPAKGMKQILDQVRLGQTRVLEEGTMQLVVDVQADGSPAKVTMFGIEKAELITFVGNVFMHQQYKPAKCDGKPCAMQFTYALKFIWRT